jgi:hypothetical protein
MTHSEEKMYISHFLDITYVLCSCTFPKKNWGLKGSNNDGLMFSCGKGDNLKLNKGK